MSGQNRGKGNRSPISDAILHRRYRVRYRTRYCILDAISRPISRYNIVSDIGCNGCNIGHNIANEYRTFNHSPLLVVVSRDWAITAEQPTHAKVAVTGIVCPNWMREAPLRAPLALEVTHKEAMLGSLTNSYIDCMCKDQEISPQTIMHVESGSVHTLGQYINKLCMLICRYQT